MHDGRTQGYPAAAFLCYDNRMIHIGLSYHGGGPEYDAYERALQDAAGRCALPVEVSWLAGRGRPFLTHRLLGLSGLCLTGGEDAGSAPERDAVEEALLAHAARKPLPLLAICRGAQILNVFNGGSLHADLGPRNIVHSVGASEHPVRFEPGTMIARIAGSADATVNTSHHQAVDRLASAFTVSATAPDGVIEAFESAEPGSNPWLLAVQWHPERPGASRAAGEGVLDEFLGASARAFHVEHPFAKGST